jgi:hypothetical protein
MLDERIANLTDLHFICSCILFGARKGHYFFDAEKPEIVRCVKDEIQTVINNKKLLDGRQALATVYTVNKKRIAVVIVSEASPGDSCYEIYAMSVIKSQQNKGYGSLILNIVLNRFLYLDICARCLPASDRMSIILEHRGFNIHSVDNNCKVMLRTAVDHYGYSGRAY